MHDLKKSRFTIEMPLEAGMETGIEAFTALYQTMTGAFVLVPETEWSDIFKRPYDLSDPELVDDLRDQGFLVKGDVDETAVFENWKQQHVHNYDTITSKVNVTRKCNNRCTYCILDYEAKEMTSDTARAMDEFYMDTINYRRPLSVRDDYLGGEPLLNTGVLLASAVRRFNHCRKNNIDYGFTITTNGVLIERMKLATAKVGLTQEENEFLDDMAIENSQCLKQSEIHANVLASLMDARASIVSNNLNVLMKTLNLITICIMVPTLVVSAFSMNVKLPMNLQEHPYAFWIIMGFATLSLIVTVSWWFSRKNR